MAHDVVYGICENKCKVPVAPKIDTDAVKTRVGTLENYDLNNRTSALEDEVDTVEERATSLESRMDTAEGRLDNSVIKGEPVSGQLEATSFKGKLFIPSARITTTETRFPLQIASAQTIHSGSATNSDLSSETITISGYVHPSVKEYQLSYGTYIKADDIENVSEYPYTYERDCIFSFYNVWNVNGTGYLYVNGVEVATLNTSLENTVTKTVKLKAGDTVRVSAKWFGEATLTIPEVKYYLEF